MFKLICIAFSLFITTCLYTQTVEALQTKTFYYDVDNYSLTQESSIVLENFIAEIKLHPIEIIEIVGYIEKTGSDVENKIRSKRRMGNLKEAIDSVIIIQQYNPENKYYPPLFLNTFTDDYNWRRVDITYRVRPKKEKLSYSKNPEDIDTMEISTNLNINNSPIHKDSLNSKNISKINDKNNPIIKDSLNKENSVKIEDNNNNPIIKDSLNSVSNPKLDNKNNPIIQDSLNKENITKLDDKHPPLIKDSLNSEKNNLIHSNNIISDSLLSSNNKTKTVEELKLIELEKIKNNIITLDSTQTDLNLDLKPQETGKISTVGKTQEEIDRLVIREKSEKTNPNRKTTHPDVGNRLAQIDVSQMDNTVILINLNLQFEGDAPLITKSSVKEINDLVRFLHNNNSVDAFIRGHVCCGDQMPLSKKRAKTVYTELIRRGISPERLRYEGFSNTIPAVFPERTDLDRSRNRRVDVMFTKTSRSNTPVELATVKGYADSLQFTEKSIVLDKNEIAYLDTKNKTQEEIDNIIITEVSSLLKKSAKKNAKNTEEKLANIDIANLKTTVSLIMLGLQFNNTDPILDESTIKEMDDLYNFLNQNKQVNAFIRGHVCCGDNMKLSKKRAKYVYDEMIKRGINKERLRYQGFSNTLLLVNPERTDIDRDKNKRVDVIFSVK